ncbi:hypothetical protein BLL52_1482 [Rhodoferax antarcticus ANT.BR]|uniref:Uncharacterized protein n=1 Tax=Rhodoferax antarcticus ANT.BR TaxID=1111071 RepID=A0A1Q8YGS6_9BURK|nr:hypothetical protein BLL52_1482 [Rhodoferax antarcticus ANT.BR]
MGSSRVATPTTRISDDKPTDRTDPVKRLANIMKVLLLKMRLVLTQRKLP